MTLDMSDCGPIIVRVFVGYLGFAIVVGLWLAKHYNGPIPVWMAGLKRESYDSTGQKFFLLARVLVLCTPFVLALLIVGGILIC